MATKPTGRKKKKKVIVEPEGLAYVKASFNNTKITITNKYGNVVSWASGGTSGFKGSRKSTPYAAQMAAAKAAKEAMDMGMVTVEVRGVLLRQGKKPAFCNTSLTETLRNPARLRVFTGSVRRRIGVVLPQPSNPTSSYLRLTC